MYNADLPLRIELPTSSQSRSIVMISAAVLLVTVALPSQYGMDRMGSARLPGLTQMSKVRMALAAEAVPTSAPAPSASPHRPRPEGLSRLLSPAQTATKPKPAQRRTDKTIVTLKPGEDVEVKMEMSKGAKAKYEWISAGGPVDHDTHVDYPSSGAHTYSKGQQVKRDAGEITAVIDGYHGWFWSNRNKQNVTITLRTNGEYRSIKRM